MYIRGPKIFRDSSVRSHRVEYRLICLRGRVLSPSHPAIGPFHLQEGNRTSTLEHDTCYSIRIASASFPNICPVPLPFGDNLRCVIVHVTGTWYVEQDPEKWWSVGGVLIRLFKA